MVLDRIRSGEIDPARSVVVESSSGNLAVGIAQLCRYHGIRFICVVDAKTSRQNLAILRAYGAEIDEVTEPDPRTGEFLERRLERVRRLVAAIPHAFWPNQYANPLNPAAHEHTMGRSRTPWTAESTTCSAPPAPPEPSRAAPGTPGPTAWGRPWSRSTPSAACSSATGPGTAPHPRARRVGPAPCSMPRPPTGWCT
ncbi:pyridoxal-phosphate dependent enzyme [Streptomyces nogalater]